MMSEQMELHDINLHTTNNDGENAYEIPQASIDEEPYENLQINRSDEPPTGSHAGSSTVCDSHTSHSCDVEHADSKLNCGSHISAFKQLQILWAVLLAIVVLSSVLIGVLIYKLVS